MDPEWNLPTNQKKEMRKRELEKVEEIMEQIDMNLYYSCKKLIVDDKEVIIKKQKEEKKRANWFALEQEQKKKEMEMEEKNKKLDMEYRLEQEKGKRIDEKIQNIITTQEDKLNELKTTKPLKLANEGPLKEYISLMED